MNKLTCIVNNNDQRYVQELNKSDNLTFEQVLSQIMNNSECSDLARILKEVNNKSVVMNIKPANKRYLVNSEDIIEPYIVTKKEEDAVYYILNINVDVFSVIG